MKRDAAWPVLAAYGAVLVGGMEASRQLVLVVARHRAGGDEASVAAEATRFALSLPGLASVAGLEALLLAVAALATAAATGGVVAQLGLGRGRVGVSGYVVAAVGAPALSAAGSAVADRVGIGQGPVMSAIADAVASGPALALVSLAVVPGIAEELFFRGLMQRRLAATLGPWPAILVASAAFGGLHLDAVQGTVAFVVGVYLGWVAHHYGSTRPAIVAHVVNNAVFIGLSHRA